MIMELLKDNLATENEQTERKNICKQCEHYKVLFCSKCGCSINLKTRLTKAKCPIDKWGKINAI